MSVKQQILICDDQHIIHETLGVYLRNEGFECISAFDGEQAIEEFNRKKPNLVILDLMMPKKSGMDVCREIRQNSSVPIIMLTAKSEEIDRVLGLELGADDYIVKPFSAREVVARVKAVLRRYSMQETEPANFKHPRSQHGAQGARRGGPGADCPGFGAVSIGSSCRYLCRKLPPGFGAMDPGVGNPLGNAQAFRRIAARLGA